MIKKEYIQGYYNDYMLYDNGKVWSNKSNRFLKTGLGTNGYLSVSLSNNGITKKTEVHRLIAIHFIEPIDGKTWVNHIDGIKTNNNVNNLEWVTPHENSVHAYNNGLTPRPPINFKDKFGYEHNRSKEVHQYDCITLSYIKSFGSANSAEKELGYGGGKISYCIKNKNKTRDGFYYSYYKRPHFELVKR